MLVNRTDFYMNVTKFSFGRRRLLFRRARTQVAHLIELTSNSRDVNIMTFKVFLIFAIVVFLGDRLTMVSADSVIRDLLPKTVDKYTNYWIHISYNGLLNAFTKPYLVFLVTYIFLSLLCVIILRFNTSLMPRGLRHYHKEDVPNYTDQFLRFRKYIFVTFANQADKEKHKQDLQDLMTKYPHKKLVVYVLPRRVPFMLELDNEIMCYDVENGRLRVLGFIQDTKDHSRLPIAMSEHKLGIRLPNEVISKNYEVMSLNDN